LLTLLLGFRTLGFVLYPDVEYFDLVAVVFPLMSLCKTLLNTVYRYKSVYRYRPALAKLSYSARAQRFKNGRPAYTSI
jgi:hypothetical protein